MRALLTALSSAVLALPALSQQLTVSPILVDAPAEGGATSISIGSTLERTVTMQVRVFGWDQDGGADRYTPARAVRFAPEIFRLEPGATQIVRMLVPDTGGNGAWRIVIDELPQKSEAPTSATAARLNIRLQYILGMFAGDAGSEADLRIDAEAGTVALVNDGDGYLRLHALAFETSDGEIAPASQSIAYVLPWSSLILPLPADRPDIHALRYAIGQTPYAAELGGRQ